MRYRVEGTCNQCGECCKVEMMWNPMLDEKGICKYLAQHGDKYICLITMSQMQIDVLKVAYVPQEHYDYWKQECYPYPDPTRRAHTPPIHELMKGCGFRMVEIDG